MDGLSQVPSSMKCNAQNNLPLALALSFSHAPPGTPPRPAHFYYLFIFFHSLDMKEGLGQKDLCPVNIDCR
jgi:hypothetical protein